MTLKILIVLLLILVQGLFAMGEMAIVSARKARLKQMADEGNKGAAAALSLAEHPSRFFSTVQIGLTLTNIVAGAYGGVKIADNLIVSLRAYRPWPPMPTPWRSAASSWSSPS